MAIAKRFVSSRKDNRESMRSAGPRPVPHSGPTRPSREIQPEASYDVLDSINHRQGDRQSAPVGVILVLDRCRIDQPQDLVGTLAQVTSPRGLFLISTVAAVKDHGPTISIMIEGPTRDQLPIGSAVSFIPNHVREHHLPEKTLAALRPATTLAHSAD